MKSKQLLMLVVLAAIIVVGLCLKGYADKSSSRAVAPPTDTSADAGFARDMGDHHQQAVDMSFTIRDKSTDPAIRLLAFDIINTQATQRGIMMGWLEQWGLPQTTSRTALAWVSNHDHDDHGETEATPASHSETSDGHHLMPGMATDEELAKLRKLGGPEADKLYMQLMIAHHEGGIDMAKSVIAQSEREEVKRLAQTMVAGQQSEIDYLKELLSR